jgi:hypothetical protein
MSANTDELAEYNGNNQNRTDYDFPPMWGQYSDEQKSAWYLRRRVYKQAIRQDTAFGNRHSEAVEEAKRLDTDRFRQ